MSNGSEDTFNNPLEKLVEQKIYEKVYEKIYEKVASKKNVRTHVLKCYLSLG